MLLYLDDFQDDLLSLFCSLICCVYLSSCVQMFACEWGQRVNFNSSVNLSDLALSGDVGRAVEMEHLQPEEREKKSWKQQISVTVCSCMFLCLLGFEQSRHTVGCLVLVGETFVEIVQLFILAYHSHNCTACSWSASVSQKPHCTVGHCIHGWQALFWLAVNVYFGHQQQKCFLGTSFVNAQF